MKVAMLTDTYDRIGGTEQAIKNSVRVLTELGHQIETIHSRRYYNIKSFLSRLHHFDPDIIHIHTPGPLGNIGVLYGKAKEIPIVGHFHSFPEVRLYFGNGIEKKAMLEFGWRLLRVFYNNCDAVIAPSREVELVLEKRKFPRCTVIPYGVDTERFKRTEGRREELGFERQDILLLYAGQFRKDKMVDLLVDAVGLLEDRYKLLLVGDGPRKNTLLKMVNDGGLSGRVVFYGPVANSDLPSFYSTADVYVNASISETLGFSMIEAMSCQTPVVASCSPGAKEIIREGKNGFLAELESPVSLADSIRKIEVGDVLAGMGAYSREFAVENYSIERMGEGLDSLYSSLY